MPLFGIKGMDWKRRLKLHDIHDTFYFEPCNFTLNPLQDFVLTYFKPEQKRVCNYQLFKLFWGVNKAKITVECFYNTFFNNIDGDNSVVKKNARIKRRFFALLYPKEVLKIDSCIEIAVLVQNM